MIARSDCATGRKTIIDIFMKMSVREQYRLIGYLSEYADRNYEKQRAQEDAASAHQISNKVIQFPSMAL